MAAQLALAGVVEGRPVRVPGRKRGLRPKPAPSFSVLPCVVLGIDPGRVSGWAIVVRGRLARTLYTHAVPSLGTATTSEQRAAVVTTALDIAHDEELPLVVVAEKWLMHGMSHDSFAGLAAEWGRWADALDGRVPKTRILRVYTQTWRARVLGGRNEAGGTPWKDRARAWAKAAHGVDVGPDAAEALAIAAWGARAGEVLERLPKRRGAA